MNSKPPEILPILIVVVALLPPFPALGDDSGWGPEPFYCQYERKRVLFISPEHPDFVLQDSNLPWVDLSEFDYEQLRADILSAIESRPRTSNEFIVVPVTHVNLNDALTISIIARDHKTESWCPAIKDYFRRQREQQRQQQMWLDMSDGVG